MDDPAIREQVAREHVTYEAHAMWSAAIEHDLMHTASTAEEGRRQNAYLEACLLHARLLAEFLDGGPTKSHEDAHAKHYLPTWASTDTLTKTERDWINWKIMHLSAERARLGGGLHLVGTAERVMMRLGIFIGSIPDAAVRGWFSLALHEQAEFGRERQRLESEGRLTRTVATTNHTIAQVIRRSDF